MVQDDILSDGEFRKCVDFHGHVCPGVAIGFRAARILIKRLGVGKASDEELIAVLENDACGADAIQVMTGCTFGKGNLIFKDFGKHAFTLAARKRQRAVRVCLRQRVLEVGREHRSLFEKMRADQASPEEKTEFERLRNEHTRRILEADGESLFAIEEVPADIPPKARVRESKPCDRCREPTRIDLLDHVKGKLLCTLCAGERLSEGRDRA
jgi:formylmethanofuran dehydrogenase subunit E